MGIMGLMGALQVGQPNILTLPPHYGGPRSRRLITFCEKNGERVFIPSSPTPRTTLLFLAVPAGGRRQQGESPQWCRHHRPGGCVCPGGAQGGGGRETDVAVPTVRPKRGPPERRQICCGADSPTPPADANGGRGFAQWAPPDCSLESKV